MLTEIADWRGQGFKLLKGPCGQPAGRDARKESENHCEKTAGTEGDVWPGTANQKARDPSKLGHQLAFPGGRHLSAGHTPGHLSLPRSCAGRTAPLESPTCLHPQPLGLWAPSSLFGSRQSVLLDRVQKCRAIPMQGSLLILPSKQQPLLSQTLFCVLFEMFQVRVLQLPTGRNTF